MFHLYVGPIIVCHLSSHFAIQHGLLLCYVIGGVGWLSVVSETLIRDGLLLLELRESLL